MSSLSNSGEKTAERIGVRLRRGREARTGWMFMLPFTILFCLTFVIPIIVSIKASFFKEISSGDSLYGGDELVSTFVGLNNYIEVVTNLRFWQGIGRVMLFGAFQIPVMIGGALVLALVLDSLVIRRVAAFRLGYFLPFAIPGVVAAMVWLYLYQPELSPILQGLNGLGIPIDFMSPNMMLLSMANITTWTFTGYNMLIFLAALQAIPGDLYEAARLDGASGFRIVWSIKIPLVRNAALLAVLLSIIGTIQLFNEPAIMATANPWMGGDYTPMMMAYNSMMGTISPAGDGAASAVSIVMAVIAGILAVLYALLQKKAD